MQNHDVQRLATIRRRLALLRWWLIGALTLAALAGPTLLDIALPLPPLLTLLGLLAVFNLITQVWGGSEEFSVKDTAAPTPGRPKSARHAPQGAIRDAFATTDALMIERSLRSAIWKEPPARGAKGGGPFMKRGRGTRFMNVSPVDLAGQLAVDLVAMGVMLYLTGGATNPLISLLLLPVTVAAFSLPARWVIGLAVLSIGIYSLLMLYSLPLPVADVARATRLHLTGMWLTFVVSVLLLAWFVTRMTQALRERDLELAAAREEALRDAQVVALGQLAAGAAHELGTPLATMNVLAGELARDPRLPEDARADLDLLRRQIGICKEIVGNLTQKAGIERAGQLQPANVWLENLLARWRTLWPNAVCTLEITAPGTPPQLIPEAAIEQAVTNLLNNAAKIAPRQIRVLLGWNDEKLTIAIQDRGPGFPPEVLRRSGAEPLPAAAEGSGIGLWLTRAAVERRGGRLSLANREGGLATIELPLGETA